MFLITKESLKQIVTDECHYSTKHKHKYKHNLTHGTLLIGEYINGIPQLHIPWLLKTRYKAPNGTKPKHYM